MGLQGVRVNFSFGVPALNLVVDTAEQLGNLRIEVIESGAGRLSVAFAAFPNGRVTLFEDGDFICVTDYSQTAPTLYRLLREALLQLGGVAPATIASPLRLPLTKGAARKDTLMVHFNSAAFLTLLVALLIAAVWAVARVA